MSINLNVGIQIIQKMLPTSSNKDPIPDFLLKLYHILEVHCSPIKKQQFSSYICWSNEGTEVLIKNTKKIEVKVLQFFYRHRKLSSFIRQMNMYNFSRVSKISKERNHLYFKNQLFKRGDLESLKLIKRNQKVKKRIQQPTDETNSKSLDAEEWMHVCEVMRMKFGEVARMLEMIKLSNSEEWERLAGIVELCWEMSKKDGRMEKYVSSCNLDSLNEESLLEKSVPDNQIPLTEPFIFPSMCSLDRME